MKKNIMMRLSAILLVAVLLTTCVISGTWAKYVKSDNAADEAKVAHWGITVEVTGEDAFAKEYEKDTDSFTAAANTVVSTEKVLAPGTTGTLGTVEIAGTPEVAYEVKVETNLALANWTVEGTYYCPLEIKVGDAKISGKDYTSMADFEAAVEKAIKVDLTGQEDGTVEYASGTNAAKTLEITWTWAFEGNSDANDTILGSAATKATVAFSLTVTVTQID